MIVLDWSAVALGLAIGVGTSALFFAGLGLGMRLALGTERPVNILALSAFIRITALLGIGWGVALSVGPFALAGFALAFFITRWVATAIVQAGVPAGDAP
ncbi:ATP synthase subunit AtpR [Tateyamaria pelophila]|uniref:ATP synthase subunit AtpR n=1 Tax=Tateyamaria pelophila TaxID=328415 RepID=UPI001CBB2943|nr:ATP synthase subunit AtpR [Tateyamaria pelophila]